MKSAVRAAHTMTVQRHGGSVGIRDEGLLDSALTRPLNLYHYEDCTDLSRLAAAYAAGIIQNYSFIDGNKRVGFASAVVFLDLNDVTLTADEVSATAMTLSFAAGEIEEANYAAWLGQNSDT